MGITVIHGNNHNSEKEDKKKLINNRNRRVNELEEEELKLEDNQKVLKLNDEQLRKKLLYLSPKDMYYSPEMIREFRMDEAIDLNPIGKEHYSRRSKLAYSELLRTLKPSSKYILPGLICMFEYLEPKYKEQLDYYDRTPLCIPIGITRTAEGNIREIMLNLHYFPPYSRAKILNTTYEVFKDYYKRYFNETPKKPNMFISWDALKALMNKHLKLAFGIKMYIPTLRSRTYLIPTRLISTAYYTEGHFSKATMRLIYQFWRKFKI